MAPHYLKTAFRSWWKNKTFSFINIIGLAAGTLCCLYILLYVADQYSYDRHQRRAADLYRVDSYIDLAGNVYKQATASPPIAPAMMKDFPEVEQYTRVMDPTGVGVVSHLLRWKDRSFYEEALYFADSTFFDVFGYRWVKGIPLHALDEPYSAVLTQPVADKLFGGADPVGQVISIDNSFGKHDFKVTGVIADDKGQSHLRANVFVSMNSNGIGAYVYGADTWAGENIAYSYVRLRPGADAGALQRKLPAFLDKHGGEQLKSTGIHKVLTLQPVTSIHTSPGLGHEPSPTVSPSFLRVLLSIALLIQLIACINFMNLSTAKASQRAKEVGVRKVLGAERMQLVRQFLAESFLLSLVGVLVALPLLVAALPWLNSLTHASIRASMLADYKVVLSFGGLVVVTALVAGCYPAFYLSAFRPVAVLKGSLRTSLGELWARKGLVVFQFTLSVIFIASVLIIYRQINYIESRDTGYNRDRIIQFGIPVKMDAANIAAASSFIKQLNNIPGVVNAAGELHNLLGDHGSSFGLDWPGRTADQYKMDFANIEVGYNFLETMGIQLKKGRYFSQNSNADREIIFNETAIAAMGLKDPIGKTVTVFGEKRQIVGIAKDFNFESVYQTVKPALFRSYPMGDQVLVKLRAGSEAATIAAVKTAYARFNPGMTFEYKYLDEEYRRLYASEIRIGVLARYFAGLAILISCLGLFGLAAFTAQKRKKEIGIRKVIGASVAQVAYLLSREFLALLGVAIAIAFPVAWLAMRHWLDGFAYRVDIGYGVFVLTALAAILITMVTISYQSIRAATANPVDALRSE